MAHYFRLFPAIHELKKHPEYLEKMSEGYRDDVLTKLLKIAVEQCKSQAASLKPAKDEAELTLIITEKIFDAFHHKLKRLQSAGPKKVINGTGIVLHTNLGRARIHAKMMAAVEEAAVHYSNLEFNLNNGSRGSRHAHAEELLKLLTGAEAAMIVNNNAAAVYLVLAALSKRSEVVVSRGELVEIGGSFRISSIMAESGAILREVGTTNKTHAYDYESAITSETAMIMKVHQSNFKMIGFTESVAREALISIADQHSCIYYEDLGSGALFDYRKSGIGEEPNLREIIASGADLVSFSGDKLFGGPQAGIILGRKKWIDLLKKHQLARILRVDKLTLAALSETLKAYLFTPERAKLEIPALRDLTDSKETICNKAERLICEASELNPLLELEVIEAESKVGGGTMPDVLLPSFAVKVSLEGKTAQTISEKLRNGSTAIVGRLHQDAFSLDCRTISEDEISLAAQLLAVL